MQKSGYMPAVDGLRTIAVFLVLLFHVDIKAFEGGFIGVDVFFVISGFLITGILLNSYQNFSFAGFYARRFRRLLPALFVTILASLVASLFISNTFDLMADGREAVYSSTSLANILYWIQSGYFDTESKNKLFLHTWSLSVEEQFYFFWPAFIVLFSVWKRSLVTPALIVALLVSVASSWYLQTDHSTAVFFLTPFRVFQFAAGGLLASMSLQLRSPLGAVIAGLATIVLLFWSYVIHLFPGYYSITTVVPTILATAILIGATNPFIEKTLGSAPMTWLGQRSYSIYLVHWPLIILWKRATDDILSVTEMIAILAASVVLGAMLHFLVEARFRDRKGKEAFPLVTPITAIMLVGSIFFGAHLWALNGRVVAKPKVSTGAVSTNESVIVAEDIVYDRASLRKQRVDSLDNGGCYLNPKSGPTTWSYDACFTNPQNNWLLVGDSYGADVFNSLANLTGDKFHFTQLAMQGCKPLLKNLQKKGTATGCLQFSDYWVKEITSRSGYDGMLLVGRWDEGMEDEIMATYDELKAQGVNIKVLGIRPQFEMLVPEFLLSSDETVTSVPIEKVRPWVLEMNDKLKKHIGRDYIDIMPLHCPKDQCRLIDEQGWPLYVDKGHMSVYGYKYFGSRMDEMMASGLK